MLSKTEKRELRSDLFRHLDGLGIAPTMASLQHRGVLKTLLAKERIEVGELAKLHQANEGYLNVALRLLCSQGWLLQHPDNTQNTVTYEINEKSAIAFDLATLYDEVDHLLKFSAQFHPRRFAREPFQLLKKIYTNYKKGYNLPATDQPLALEVRHQMLKHIEGIIVGPTVVQLGMSGMFHKYFMEASFRPEEFHADAQSFSELLTIFRELGWFTEQNGAFTFSEKGLFYAKRAAAYGVTVSYIPTFRRVDDLIFGDPKAVRITPDNEPEQHVDRDMNVWGSGGAHSGYFKVIDQIIIEIFNRPIQEQPKGILDMGCGNGAFLQHLFEVIENQTARGKVLDEYPLFLVGADFNQAALRITRANLIQADIWAKVIWGDIGRPDLLADDIKSNYGIDLSDLLNVRTFLDHNRIWSPPTHPQADRQSTSTGAFTYLGERLSNARVEDNLLEHLGKWTPYVKKFGLLVIELHTLPPALTAGAIGTTPATAYDATHGYSDQYIVEMDVFQRIAAEAGLEPDARFTKRFPDSELATVSIHLLKERS